MIKRSLLTLTAVCLFMTGCMEPTDDHMTQIRIESLENQVTALEQANKTLAEASIANSESIKKLSEAIIKISSRGSR